MAFPALVGYNVGYREPGVLCVTDNWSERRTAMPEKYETPELEVLDIGEDVILTSGEEPAPALTTISPK